MMRRNMLGMFIILSSLAVTAHAAEGKRWYSEAQLQLGEQVYGQHCASCHGKQAEGTPDWRKTGPDGKYPPPPLNGTAHAWHHSLRVLLRQIRMGGKPLGGTMPGFAGKLSNEEMLAAIAWFQSHWPDNIYRIWEERNRPRSSVRGGLKAPITANTLQRLDQAGRRLQGQ